MTLDLVLEKVLCTQGQTGGEPLTFDPWMTLLNSLPLLIGILIVVIIIVVAYRLLRPRKAEPVREVRVEREVVTLVVCPSCGARNRQGQVRCSECGAKL